MKQPVLAYLNEDFLKTPEARSIRLLSEYLEPLHHFRKQKVQDTIVFFGSARIHPDNLLGRYYEEARELARMLTEWSESQPGEGHRYVICSGGGPGIMEAANRGASEANGKTIGLNIGLPFEQQPNPYITEDLSFQFHYFFMRKFWFAYMAKALVVFPGGFGTMDELFEILTLLQTGKLKKKMQIILYGTDFWKEVLNFEALVRYGTIAEKDLELFHFADDTETAFRILRDFLDTYDAGTEPDTPAIAGTAKPA
jgi:uncharacterized protein (TIGR00730 family)